MEVVTPLLGAGLVAVALTDMFLIVLYLRGGTGLITPALSRLVWGALRAVGRLTGEKHGLVLAYSGPLLLVAIATVWAGLTWVGFGLMVWPALGGGIRATAGATPTDFATALYYAGFSLTTLGTGDLTPRTGGWRLATVAAAGLGFSSFTLVVTYFLSVYSALRRRNVFANALHQRTAATGSPIEYLVRLTKGAEPSRARQDFDLVLVDMVDLYESHRFYPVLHYFRHPEPRYSLARVTFVILDTYSLMQAALDPDEHGAVLADSATRGLWESTEQLLKGLSDTFLSGHHGERMPNEARLAAWRAHLGSARKRLAAEGVALGSPAVGEDRYLELRTRWQPWVDDFAARMDFRIETVMGGEPESVAADG